MTTGTAIAVYRHAEMQEKDGAAAAAPSSINETAFMSSPWGNLF